MVRTASLALRALSSILALFSVPRSTPNIDFPFFLEGSTVKSSLGRFLLPGAIAAGPVGALDMAASSSAAAVAVVVAVGCDLRSDCEHGRTRERGYLLDVTYSSVAGMFLTVVEELRRGRSWCCRGGQ